MTLALTAPLNGAQLIEASAGTGKTWTIAGLYLRLVLERRLLPEQILVVTFTKAATAELRERLRTRLAHMLRRIDAGQCDEAFCDALYEAQGLTDDDKRADARRLLVAALHGFDQAAIYTIHGFCQRALADRAFASGLPFALELVPDPSAVLEQVVADFWRRKIVAWDPADAAVLPQALHAQYALAALRRAPGEKQEPTPATLARVVGAALARHEVALAGGDAVPPQPELEAQLQAAWATVRAEWPQAYAELRAKISADKRLSRSYARNHLATREAKCAAALAQDDFSAVTKDEREALAWFGRAKLEEKANEKAGASGPFAPDALADRIDALFDGAARIDARADAWRDWTRRRCIEWARTEFPARLRAARTQGFNDLLANLHAALCAPRGAALARTLAERYPAALIDEFQDTDALQFETFKRIYEPALEGKGGASLIFVGDPKQAIYSFRGADLHAYLAAANWAQRLPPLRANFRSDARLIDALNAVFMQPQRQDRAPFRMPELQFVPVEAGRAGAAGALRLGDETDPPPLVFERLPAREDGKAHTKGEARERIAQAVASEIAWLLDPASGASLNGAPVAGRDIAVLVGKHAQGDLVRRALAARGIGCAARATASVWASDEAAQLLRLFGALAQLQHEARVRAALVTDLIGLDASALARREHDEDEAQRWQQKLERWALVWRRQGALALLRTVLVDCEAYARLAAMRDGERRLTNLAHLAELIAAEEPRLHGADALVAWLARQVEDPPGGEAAELRLESDENLVQIVTVHKSKGLEYGIVFAPFLWEGVGTPEGLALVHEAAPPHRAVLDLAPDDAASARAQSERYDESLRLAYVALTRAKHRCQVVWGEIADAEASPLAWFVFGGGPQTGGLPERAVIDAGFAELERAGAGAIAVRTLVLRPAAAVAMEAKADTLVAAKPPAPLPAPLRQTSFSGLMHGASAADLPDHDQFAAGAEAGPDAAMRFAFPRGAAAGDCLHAIAERIDWQAPSADWLPAIRAALRAMQADARFADLAPEAVAQWLDEVRQAPLDIGATAQDTHGQASATLGRVPCQATRREIAFALPLHQARFDALADAARAAGYAVPHLSAEQWRGSLRGYIDLVYQYAGKVYIADYKSNALGLALDDYHPQALEDAMHAHGYHLQHLLYTVAVDRWLRARIAGYDYDTHFGGVRYLFLRGMSPAAPGRGVVSTRAPRALIETLSRLLDAASAKEAA